MKLQQKDLVYRGKRTTPVNIVTATREGQLYPLPSRLDLAKHSPDGFEWGYGGSGPAQLSLGLLTDYFGSTAQGDAFALSLYQDFKFAIIAGFKGPTWELTGEQIGEQLVRIMVEDEKCIHRILRNLSLHLFTIWSKAHEESADPADYQDERINAWIDQRCRELLGDCLPLKPETIERFLREAKASI